MGDTFESAAKRFARGAIDDPTILLGRVDTGPMFERHSTACTRCTRLAALIDGLCAGCRPRQPIDEAA